MREKAAAIFSKAQSEICDSLEALDGAARFRTDNWERREESGTYGGGGKTCILQSPGVFEQAGVNFSEVYGTLPLDMSQKLVEMRERAPFYATGISVVVHPISPIVPTTHANFRFLEVADRRWFGGGMDLTPYYFFEEDARSFHQTIKSICNRHDASYYPHFKKWCDEYFYLPHRGETRGIGGIFFDYLGKELPENLDEIFAFVADCSMNFLTCYLPIVERRLKEQWSENEKQFQLIRRGRYVEFNLLYDRGTQFGLKTGGRTESILMSLPPQVKWEYDYSPALGSREWDLTEVLRNPREWA